MVNSSTQLMALKLNSSAGTFSIYANLSLSSIPTTNAVVVGESCNLVMSGSTVYSLDSTGLKSLRSFSNIKAYSSSLMFIIDGNLLYGYTSSSFVFTYLPIFSSYNINNNLANNLIISGYNVTGKANFSIQQTIFFVIFSNNNFNIFNQTEVGSTNSPANSIPVMVSPQMTKIHYQFYSGSNLTVVFSQVDFNNQNVSPITFKSETQFLTTTGQMTAFTNSNYFLGDDYLIIRNDSSLTTNNGYNVEEAYSFMSQTLFYLRTRNLLNTEVGKCFRTYIDSFFVDSLIVLDLYDSGSTTN